MTNQLEQALACLRTEMPALELRERELLKEHSSFKIGGPVRAFALPDSIEQLRQLCGILARFGVRPYVLGNGTNILFPDEGSENAFVLSTAGLNRLERTENGCLEAEAGVSLARLAALARSCSLTGLEFASGIPGTVGGGLVMNAGAYGGELKDAVVSVRAMDPITGEICEYACDDCEFVYRGSIFKRNGALILSARFALQDGNEAEIAAKMRELNEKRREKQPLEYPSAGSTFKRPEGCFAAAMIDQAGLKGFRVGGAQVSEKHAGFVINAGGATAAEVKELMRRVQAKVLEQTGIMLEPEILMPEAGFDPSGEE